MGHGAPIEALFECLRLGRGAGDFINYWGIGPAVRTSKSLPWNCEGCCIGIGGAGSSVDGCGCCARWLSSSTTGCGEDSDAASSADASECDDAVGGASRAPADAPTSTVRGCATMRCTSGDDGGGTLAAGSTAAGGAGWWTAGACVSITSRSKYGCAALPRSGEAPAATASGRGRAPGLDTSDSNAGLATFELAHPMSLPSPVCESRHPQLLVNSLIQQKLSHLGRSRNDFFAFFFLLCDSDGLGRPRTRSRLFFFGALTLSSDAPTHAKRR